MEISMEISMENNNTDAKAEKKLHFNFIFSSITFLTIYLPLVKILKSRNIPFIFFKRRNCKKYACPYLKKKECQEYYDKYNIKVLSISKLKDYPGITFCIDGDVYGPKSLCYKQSAVHDLNKYENRDKYLVVSLPENANYLWIYDKFIKLVDYAIFPNSKYTFSYGFDNPKNLFIGTPKFNILLQKQKIREKHNLPKRKYAIIFYPEYRIPIGQKKYPNFMKFYDNIYKWLRELGYTIIVKDRKKGINKITTFRKGDYYFDNVEYFPLTSIELIKISSLAIFFSSSVIEEIVMCKVPFIDVAIDNIDRFNFLRDKSYSYIIKTLPDKHKFKKRVKKLRKNKKNYKFDEIIQKCLFNRSNVPNEIIDKTIELQTSIPLP